MKRRVFLLFLFIAVCTLFVVIFTKPKYSSEKLKEIQGTVDSIYKIKSESLTVIQSHRLTITQKKILVKYSQYQQGILEVFTNYSKSRDHSLKFRLTLVCAELFFKDDQSKILDEIFFSVFNTNERLIAHEEYIQHLRGQMYPNLAEDPSISQKCENLY